MKSFIKSDTIIGYNSFSMFQLTAPFKPTGDQPQAIEKLVKGISSGLKNQVLLGVTGSGKTFTMANIIEKLQMPALIISHNKTLAGQLYQEMRDFFPQNAVSYFVSYYDYYQPEAYMPATGTYIEKEAQINELIDKLRLQATTNILTRNDTICVASVSCIYNIGSPVEYGKFILSLKVGEGIEGRAPLRQGSEGLKGLDAIMYRLAELQYERSEFEFVRGSFRLRGAAIDIYPAYEDYGYRVTINNNVVKEIVKFEPISGKVIQGQKLKVKSQKYKSKVKNNNLTIEQFNNIKSLIVYPAKHYMTDPNVFNSVEKQIRLDLADESNQLKKQGKPYEADRLIKRVNYDLEMIKEVGYVNGIENYSRYFDGRKIGDPPFSLIDYYTETYGNNWLLFIDESHMTIPQLRGMHNGDHSRKKTLIDFGFRLKASYDNRPLKFEEFYPKAKRIVYFSATPDEWEIGKAKTEAVLLEKRHLLTASVNKYNGIAEQLIRPTGIIDPVVTVKPAKNEVEDLIGEIKKRVALKHPTSPKGLRGAGKILVTTLTKKTAEDLSEYLVDKKIRSSYLHSDIKTLERSDILDNLRKNEFDVLIGVNLLREGLDLPEVTLVAILDADKEGFLRSRTSLIQTMGRAARNITGEIIMYADSETKSMNEAIGEINRRRKYQVEYNKKNNITAKTIYKPIREKIVKSDEITDSILGLKDKVDNNYLSNLNEESLTPYDRNKLVKRLKNEMKKQAEDLNFELAIKIRDKVKQLQIK